MRDRMSRGDRRRGGRRDRLSRLLLLGSAALLVAGGWLLVDYIRQGAQTRDLQSDLQQWAQQKQTAPAQATDAPTLAAQNIAATAVPHTPVPVTTAPLPTQGAPILANLLPVYAKNRDLVGWLKASGIQDINFPIVQRDNSHYVNHDFYGRRNVAGTVFLDADNHILPQDQNLILHGHNMKNGTMFGKLARLLSPEQMARSPLFDFSTLYHTQTYVPYAIALTSINPGNANAFSFLVPAFANQEAWQAYTGWLTAHSALALPVDVQPQDQLLTLVTCHGHDRDERLVLALRALRPDESADDVQGAFARWREGQM